jgi:hypothetical protein
MDMAYLGPEDLLSPIEQQQQNYLPVAEFVRIQPIAGTSEFSRIQLRENRPMPLPVQAVPGLSVSDTMKLPSLPARRPSAGACRAGEDFAWRRELTGRFCALLATDEHR